MKKIFLLSLSISLASCASSELLYERPSPVTRVDNNHVRVAANENYDRASKSKKLFFGKHYRAEWATPVTVEIFDLDSLAGQFLPTKMGGGMQTKSLRLKGSNGKEYVLRSINKDPSKALPAEFVGTFADDVIQDQISSSNPYAPLAVAALAESAGVYHSEPKIVYVTSSRALGEFNAEFGNTLCLLEERPVGDQRDNAAFGNSKNIITSEKLFERIFDSPDHRVDQQAFLTARLFDMWIGDWDRHEDQWVWASFKEGKVTTYRPIPRDRDQAFANLDGLIPQLAARKWAVRKTQNFDYTIRDISGLNLNGNYLDRLFTNELTRENWEEITETLKEKLTDEAIEKAFTHLPEEIFALSGKVTIDRLKQRRDDLLKYAVEYYEFLADQVIVLGSDKKERFEVNRLNDLETELIVTRKSQKDETEELFRRILRNEETDEVRLYGLGGADEFELHGKTRQGLLIRVIGGDGKDSIRNESSVRGSAIMTRIYDNESTFVKARRDTRFYITSDTIKTQFQRRWFQYDVLSPMIAPGYNPDDGFYFGGGLSFKKFQFGKYPFGYKQSLWGNYAFATGAYNFQYDARVTEAFGSWDLIVKAKVNAPNFIYNYYGKGNETKVINDNWLYHRVRLNQILVEPSVERKVGKHGQLQLGLNYQRMHLQRSEDRYVANPAASMDSSAFKSKHYAGAKVAYHYIRTNRAFYPTEGFYTKVEAEQIFQVSEATNKANFTRFSAQAAWFGSLGVATVGVRAGATALTNDSYAFYQAATVGGMDNLRGYRRTRFSGQYSAYQNTDIRIRLGKGSGYVFRGTYGVMAFADVGRVWVTEESSNTWHTGYGAGFWVLPFNKMTFTATYEMSSETNLFNIRTGFLF